MLVFNPIALPEIFDTLITSYPISLKDPTPANTLYMLARFACLTCDHTWLEDLIMGAADTIEEAFFVSFTPHPSEGCCSPAFARTTLMI
jgi:hypothetical protein